LTINFIESSFSGLLHLFWELFHVLPFIIGNMPPDDPHYACFLLLNDKVTILFSPVIAHDSCNYEFRNILSSSHLFTLIDH